MPVFKSETLASFPVSQNSGSLCLAPQTRAGPLLNGVLRDITTHTRGRHQKHAESMGFRQATRRLDFVTPHNIMTPGCRMRVHVPVVPGTFPGGVCEDSTQRGTSTTRVGVAGTHKGVENAEQSRARGKRAQSHSHAIAERCLKGWLAHLHKAKQNKKPKPKPTVDQTHGCVGEQSEINQLPVGNEECSTKT